MRKPTPWIAAGDNHGSECEPGAVEAFFDFAKKWKPKIRVHSGDCFDFACFRSKASDEERRHSLQDDIDAGCDFLRRLQPTHYLRGNHDERLWDVMESDDEKMSDLCFPIAEQIKEACGDAKIFPYCKRRGVFNLGDVSLLHGYSCGIGAARQIARTYGRAIMWHVHSADYASEPGHPRRKEGWTSGALARLDLKYNRGTLSTLRQTHGWMYGLLYPNGKNVVFQATRLDGVGWVLPSEVMCLQ